MISGSTIKRNLKIMFKLFVCLFSLMLLFYSFTDHSEKLDDWLRKGQVYQDNIAYLEKAAEDAGDQLFKLAALDGLFRTISSTDVGFSLILQAHISIGHELAVLTDFLGKTIEITLLAALSAEFIKLVLELADFVTPFVYQLTLILVALFCFTAAFGSAFSALKNLSHRLLSISLMALLLMHIAIPYAVNITALLSDSITSELRSDTKQHISALHDEHFQDSGKVHLKDKAEHYIHKFERAVVNRLHKTESLMSHYIRYLAATIIEGILFPFVLLLLLFFGLRVVVQEMMMHIKPDDKLANTG